MRHAVPMKNARGKLRCGSTVSPALNVAYCHPSYAHKTPSMARPKPDHRVPSDRAGHKFAPEPAEGRPSDNRTTLINTIVPTLTAVIQFCRFELWRVPRTLTIVTTASMASASNFAVTGDIGTT